ncbi:MAG: phage major capsid protein [Sulfuriferula sp.]
MNLNPKDFVQAHRDAAMIRAGLLTASDPICHPDAGALAAGGAKLLSVLARFVADKEGLTRSPSAAGRQPSAGFGLPDFSAALGDVLRSAAYARMAVSMQHQQIATRLNVLNFMPHQFPMARIESDLLPANELGEYEDAGLADLPGLSAKLSTFGRNILISRQLLLTDDIGLIASAFANFGASAARREAWQVYALLESNPALADAELMFDPAHGNVLAAAFDESNLGIAMGMLRSLADPFGAVSNFDAAVLVVEGRLELLARRLVRDAGLGLKVVASPWLAAGRWYLMPSPDVAPVIGLLRLTGAKFPVMVDPAKINRGQTRDGTLIGVRADLGVCPLSRTAIKGGV